MSRRFLCRLGFHRWVGVEPTLADAIRGRFMARMKCHDCKQWHSDHDISLPKIDKEVEVMCRKLVIL